MKGLWLAARRAVAVIVTAAVFAVAAVHIAVGDRFAVLAPLTYATPYPLLLVAAVPLAIIHACCRSRRLAVACLVLAVIAGWQWVGMWGNSPSTSPAGPACRLLFWNAASPRHPSPDLIAAVRAEEPELVVLAEAGKWSAADRERYRDDLPGYHAVRLPDAMLVFSRRPMTVRESRRLPNRTAIHVLAGETSVGPVRLVLTDVGSDPLSDRKPLIAEVLEVAGSDPDTVVLGDFNTPYDSVAFDPFRERFAHALKDAGSGPIETWPSVAPCLAIDHVWLASAFVPVAGRKRWSDASDHAMVLADFARR
jgi:endonuclease/exonuclease/phosphatase (EEP) superfamily protein YafD